MKRFANYITTLFDVIVKRRQGTLLRMLVLVPFMLILPIAVIFYPVVLLLRGKAAPESQSDYIYPMF